MLLFWLLITMISMMKKTSQKKALARMTGLGFEAGEDGEGVNAAVVMQELPVF